MSRGELEFYPKHPSGEKTHRIETAAMPMLEQDEPFQVKNLYDEFKENAETFFAKYVDKRFEVTGIAKKVGPDIHNKPSIEISDSIEGQTYALVIFPTDDHYKKVKVGDTVIVRANYLVMSNHYGTVMKYSELLSVENKNDAEEQPMVLSCPCFDGENVVENARVEIKGGKISRVEKTDTVDENCFLVPGFIDAHTHINTRMQTEAMLKNGVIATCDVAADVSMARSVEPFTLVSSAGMTMGTLNGKSYVQSAIAAGAKYIKVLLMEPNFMLKKVLKDICDTAHDNGKKVAVHAVSVKAVEMAVDCGSDILLHVPMKEKYPEKLAKTIAEKRIAVVPTLVMMETYAKNGRNGYKLEHYKNAEHAVKLLYENGVTILAGTDANPGTFAPAVAYGTTMHREMELLVQAGMKPKDVLASATSKVAEVFGIADLGAIEEGKRATFLLIEGRPDQQITDTTKIKQIWIDGKQIL